MLVQQRISGTYNVARLQALLKLPPAHVPKSRAQTAQHPVSPLHQIMLVCNVSQRTRTADFTQAARFELASLALQMPLSHFVQKMYKRIAFQLLRAQCDVNQPISKRKIRGQDGLATRPSAADARRKCVFASASEVTFGAISKATFPSVVAFSRATSSPCIVRFCPSRNIEFFNMLFEAETC